MTQLKKVTWPDMPPRSTGVEREGVAVSLEDDLLAVQSALCSLRSSAAPISSNPAFGPVADGARAPHPRLTQIEQPSSSPSFQETEHAERATARRVKLTLR
jgi:hypothetical protein